MRQLKQNGAGYEADHFIFKVEQSRSECDYSGSDWESSGSESE
jgi:hypothetical protein